MTSSAISGYSMTLRIEGAAIAENQNFTLTMNQDTIDVTSRDSSRWRELISGTRSWSISGDGLYIYTNVGKRILQRHYTDRSPATLTCVLTLADGTITASGEAILTSLDYAGPHADAASISFTLEGTADLTISTS